MVWGLHAPPTTFPVSKSRKTKNRLLLSLQAFSSFLLSGTGEYASGTQSFLFKFPLILHLSSFLQFQKNRFRFFSGTFCGTTFQIFFFQQRSGTFGKVYSFARFSFVWFCGTLFSGTKTLIVLDTSWFWFWVGFCYLGFVVVKCSGTGKIWGCDFQESAVRVKDLFEWKNQKKSSRK